MDFRLFLDRPLEFLEVKRSPACHQLYARGATAAPKGNRQIQIGFFGTCGENSNQHHDLTCQMGPGESCVGRISRATLLNFFVKAKRSLKQMYFIQKDLAIHFLKSVRKKAFLNPSIGRCFGILSYSPSNQPGTIFGTLKKTALGQNNMETVPFFCLSWFELG